MSSLPETYLRQARSFLLSGEPARSVELLKKAKALAGRQPQLLVPILQDLCNACKLAGQTEEAGNYYLQLQSLIGPPDTRPSAPKPATRPAWLIWALAGCMAVGSSVPAWWLYARNRTSPSSVSSSPASVLERQRRTPREQLLHNDVGLLAVVAHYSQTFDGRLINIAIPSAFGTAFPVTADGLMVTNNHVVAAANDPEIPTTLSIPETPLTALRLIRVSYLVCFGPTAADQFPAKLQKQTNNPDLAFLRIEHRFSRPLTLCAKPPHQGDEVFACGYPGVVRSALNSRFTPDQQQIQRIDADLGKTGEMNLLSFYNPDVFDSTLTRGVVSAAERNVDGEQLIQFDAKVAHGNSGGPLLNSNDEVIGIVVSGLEGNLESEGYNFAIPVQLLKSELPG